MGFTGRRVVACVVVAVTATFLLTSSLSAKSFYRYPAMSILKRPNHHSVAVAPLFPQSSQEGTILWSGFRHTWDDHPHRLSQLGSAFKSIDYHEGSSTVGARHSARFRVGAVNDTGYVRSKGQYVKSAALGFHHGSVTSSCLETGGRVGEEAVVRCHRSIDLGAIDFDYDQVTVVLRGFEVHSTSYDTGYNTRGFTVRVIPDGREGDRYYFDALFKVHPEHSPDRPLIDDRCGNGSHCQYYSYRAKIYYTLVGVNDDDGNIEESGYNSYGQYVRMSPFKIPSLASSSSRWDSIQGEPDFRRALVAMQGFSWHLGAWGRTRKDGRYIRDLRFDISSLDYDRASGQARFKTNMYFHNSGAWPYGFNANYKMWTTLIQVDDPHFKKTSRRWFSGEIGRGGTTFSEDVDHTFD